MNNSLFGTDGIRTQVGKAPLTSETLPQLARAISYWLAQKYENPLVAIAQDTRLSGDWIKTSLIQALLQQGINITDFGVISTPMLGLRIMNGADYAIGIMITASHNPYTDNGIKIIDTKGKISFADEQEISSLYYQQPTTTPNWNKLGSITIDNTITEQYLYYLNNKFPAQFLEEITIIIDTAHGALSNIAPLIFTHFGATVITLNNQPNGKNINENCGATAPQNLAKKVLEYKADIGFAFDGDGDRLLVVSKQGTIKNGDDLLWILANHHSHYCAEKKVVGTVMTNSGFSAQFCAQGKELLRAAVGDKNVIEMLERENLLLGAEQSGHIIIRDHGNFADGMYSALRIVQAVLGMKDWSLPSFKSYAQLLINIPITQKKDLNHPSIAQVINDYESRLQGGRILLRYSGTEPLLRLMIESDSAEIEVKKIAQEMSNKFQQLML